MILQKKLSNYTRISLLQIFLSKHMMEKSSTYWEEVIFLATILSYIKKLLFIHKLFFCPPTEMGKHVDNYPSKMAEEKG